MASSSRDIRRRIKSINSTRKITRAMEMVSAAKMRRAVASVLAIRPYAHSAWSILTNLARAFREEYGRGLLEIREVRSVLVLLVTSNRGFCGSFNAQIMKKIREEVRDPKRLKMNRVSTKEIESSVADEDLSIDFVTIGKKGEKLVRKMSREIVATFPELMNFPKAADVRAVSKIVIDDYLAKKYDKVVIAYTDYVSAIVQEPKIRQLLPISKVDLEKQIAEMDSHSQQFGLKAPKTEYKVEPDPATVLDQIFPRLIEMQIFHAILESNASQESARMVAMRNATDAASDMSVGLTLMYNQIRQMKITNEIAEISAGRAALE